MPGPYKPVTVALYGTTYIAVESLRHWQTPLSKLPPACAAARSAYRSIRKRNGTGIEPCEVCSAIEDALKQ